jgi:hypothetical protein
MLLVSAVNVSPNCGVPSSDIDDATFNRSKWILSADYEAGIGDDVIAVDASGGAVTISFPVASDFENKIWTIKKIDSSSNAVILDPDSSETIDGATTYSISTQYDSVSIISNGTNFEIVNSNLASGDTISPASNTDSSIPQWDGADSKALKNGFNIATGVGDNDKLATQGYVDDNSGAGAGGVSIIETQVFL